LFNTAELHNIHSCT